MLSRSSCCDIRKNTPKSYGMELSHPPPFLHTEKVRSFLTFLLMDSLTHLLSFASPLMIIRHFMRTRGKHMSSSIRDNPCSPQLFLGVKRELSPRFGNGKSQGNYLFSLAFHFHLFCVLSNSKIVHVL